MKATGIVRRIDDLGRVVIPREIRRNLHIKEGDPLELFVYDDGVCFKPYDAPYKAMGEHFASIAKLIKQTCNVKVALYTDTVRIGGECVNRYSNLYCDLRDGGYRISPVAGTNLFLVCDEEEYNGLTDMGKQFIEDMCELTRIIAEGEFGLE